MCGYHGYFHIHFMVNFKLDIHGRWPKLKVVFGAYQLWMPLTWYNYFYCDLSLDYTRYPSVGLRILRLGCFELHHRSKAKKKGWIACKKCGYVYDVYSQGWSSTDCPKCWLELERAKN
jgi:hypothetical protein